MQSKYNSFAEWHVVFSWNNENHCCFYEIKPVNKYLLGNKIFISISDKRSCKWKAKSCSIYGLFSAFVMHS